MLRRVVGAGGRVVVFLSAFNQVWRGTRVTQVWPPDSPLSKGTTSTRSKVLTRVTGWNG